MSDDEQSRPDEEIKKGLENPTYMDLPEPDEPTSPADGNAGDNTEPNAEEQDSS